MVSHHPALHEVGTCRDGPGACLEFRVWTWDTCFGYRWNDEVHGGKRIWCLCPAVPGVWAGNAGRRPQSAAIVAPVIQVSWREIGVVKAHGMVGVRAKQSQRIKANA